jgi:ATP/maltotriose-dependent transcriptional regulator MalT
VPAKIRVPVAESLPRERLESRLAEAWRHRLTLVIAPAGSGKTTLVARFAATAGVPAGWYRAETWDADEASLIRHLEAALVAVMPGLSGGWRTVGDAARSLEAQPLPRALLVIDDGHALEGTAAETTLGRFVEYAPPWLAVVVAGRVAPSINLPRLRVSGELLELGTDDLRFRAWEVEQLFRDVYTIRSRRPTSRPWPSASRAGPPACSCSTSRRAAGPSRSAAASSAVPAAAGACCASTSPRT